jgi:bifunctional UDP-N-acetylglucosamine pyrophosphorylase/glucosamine-1-phosphate N-acetyltransferase
MMENVHAIVLAAGKGTRMKAKTIPKVLFPVAGKPMLAHLLESLADAGITKPVIVVGFLAKKVIETFGNSYPYAFQRMRLGTGHAVMSAKEHLIGKPGCTLIVNGDHPFFRPGTIQRMITAVTERKATVAVLSGLMTDPEFDAFGRVVTDEEGHVLRIVEVKDATEEEKKIRQVNLGCYAVDNEWLWQTLKGLKKSTATGEYYITDIVGAAVKEGKKVTVVHIEDKAEALGINTLDHLAEAERISQAVTPAGK